MIPRRCRKDRGITVLVAVGATIDAAEFLKTRNPQSVVEVKDLQSGAVTAIAHKAHQALH
jgi:hypothetical protein